MDAVSRIERALETALGDAGAAGAPPRLAAAMRHSVFPRGARIRPRLCLAVARACGDDAPELSVAAAVAIELMHCASLVHDDLPCFDDAATRRGRPTVHKTFGQDIAVLAGDALIVLAFQTLARAARLAPARLGEVTLIVAESVGMPCGIAAGQAWESEPAVDLARYHQAKTGSLFAGATLAGAAAAGSASVDSWRLLGERLGEAYQVADDLRDAISDEAEIGKPVGKDRALGRPNAVAALGLAGAVERLRVLADAAVAAVPDCPGGAELRSVILSETRRLMPARLPAHAA
ncbi:MAG: polyprenyl synthetase family protein [Proteobacteria bacterium]|nr:polyprenyl synthetase family protein [Pseudomonadota bacterium]